MTREQIERGLLICLGYTAAPEGTCVSYQEALAQELLKELSEYDGKEDLSRAVKAERKLSAMKIRAEKAEKKLRSILNLANE